MTTEPTQCGAVVIMFLLAVTVQGRTNEPIWQANENTNRLETKSESTKRVIKELATSGEICKVFGHWWDDKICPGAYSERLSSYRKCNLCGKAETKKAEWK